MLKPVTNQYQIKRYKCYWVLHVARVILKEVNKQLTLK